MEFVLYRTSGETITHPKVVPTSFTGSTTYYTVDLDTLDDLLMFCRELGSDVIVREDRPNTLEVYDDYRE